MRNLPDSWGTKYKQPDVVPVYLFRIFDDDSVIFRWGSRQITVFEDGTPYVYEGGRIAKLPMVTQKIDLTKGMGISQIGTMSFEAVNADEFDKWLEEQGIELTGASVEVYLTFDFVESPTLEDDCLLLFVGQIEEIIPGKEAISFKSTAVLMKELEREIFNIYVSSEDAPDVSINKTLPVVFGKLRAPGIVTSRTAYDPETGEGGQKVAFSDGKVPYKAIHRVYVFERDFLFRVWDGSGKEYSVDLQNGTIIFQGEYAREGRLLAGFVALGADILAINEGDHSTIQYPLRMIDHDTDTRGWFEHDGIEVINNFSLRFSLIEIPRIDDANILGVFFLFKHEPDFRPDNEKAVMRFLLTQDTVIFSDTILPDGGNNIDGNTPLDGFPAEGLPSPITASWLSRTPVVIEFRVEQDDLYKKFFIYELGAVIKCVLDNLSRKRFFADIEGRVYGDWASFYPSGDVIENPVGVVESILREDLGVAPGGFLNAYDKRDGYIVARAFTKPIRVYDALHSIAKEGWFMFVGSDGSFKIKFPDDDSVFTIDASMIEKDRHNKRYSPFSSIFNDFTLEYDYDYVHAKFRKILRCNPEESDVGETLRDACQQSEERYRVRRPLTMKADWIHDDGTAHEFLEHAINWFTRRHKIYKIRGFYDLLPVELGDVVTLLYPETTTGVVSQLVIDCAEDRVWVEIFEN